MPQDLAALLVEEGAVSQADMERALARQAERGGALDTALLELELIGEGHLRSFLSHASGLPAVPPGALREIDPRARRVFPAKVAERHRLAPFAIDGRELSVAAVHPIDQAAVDEIGFMLSLTLVPHVATEWQVHDLIQRLYGGQLPARLARLAESEQRQAGGAAPPATPVPVARIAPPPPQPPVPPPASKSLEDAFFAAGESGTFVPAPEVAEPPPEAAAAPPAAVPAPADETSFAGLDETPPPEGVPEPLPEAPPPPEPPPAAAPESPPSGGADEASFGDIEPERKSPSGFARGADEPAEPLLAALELAVDAYDALWADAAPEPSAQHHAEEAAPAEADAQPAVLPAAAEPGAAEVEPPLAETEPPPAEEPAPEEPEEPEPPPPQLDRSAPPRWSIGDARAALAASVHRDEVVLTALRYARDFFEFSALFAVTRDAVVGHDALGPEESARLHARGSAIYAEDPGVVRTVLETRAPYLGPVVRDAVGTTNILDGLWRGTPRTVLLYPVLVGDRAVAVLYADNGEAPVSARRLGDLLLFLSMVGGAFERIIRAHKKRRPRAGRRAASAAAPPPPPPAQVADANPSLPTPSWMAPPPDSAPAVEERADAPARAAEGEPPPPAEEPPPAEPAEDPAPPVGEAGPGEAVAEPEPPPVAGAGTGEAVAGLESPPVADAVEPLEPEPEAEPRAEAEAGPASAPAASSPVEEAIALLLAGGHGPPDRVAPIVDLLLSPAPGVAEAACEALAQHRGHAAVKPVPERLRRGLLSGVGERPVLAARALGALRDVESIPILIQAFEGGSAEGARAAADALARITLQRLGPSAQKWLRWWKENRGRSRAEWLFAALTSADRDLRVAAAEELRAAAETPVAYSPDLPSAELEAAARSWWVWWSRQGVRI